MCTTLTCSPLVRGCGRVRLRRPRRAEGARPGRNSPRPGPQLRHLKGAAPRAPGPALGGRVVKTRGFRWPVSVRLEGIGSYDARVSVAPAGVGQRGAIALRRPPCVAGGGGLDGEWGRLL